MKAQSKIALVTGGSRGLGIEMAIRIAQKGLSIILTYNSQSLYDLIVNFDRKKHS